MPSRADKLFKSKRKQRKDLKRRSRELEEKPRILIVCEGEKTEVHYFKSLISLLSIPSADVVSIEHAGKSDPKAILEYAFKRVKDAKKELNPITEAYIVIDRDTHSSFDSTLCECNSTHEVCGIYSIPCFEYWILLHFEYCDRPYSATGSRSVCEKVIEDDLNRYIPGYSKASRETMDSVVYRYSFACQNAKRSVKDGHARGEVNPSSNVFQVVERLEKLKK